MAHPMQGTGTMPWAKKNDPSQKKMVLFRSMMQTERKHERNQNLFPQKFAPSPCLPFFRPLRSVSSFSSKPPQIRPGLVSWVCCRKFLGGLVLCFVCPTWAREKTLFLAPKETKKTQKNSALRAMCILVKTEISCALVLQNCQNIRIFIIFCV